MNADITPPVLEASASFGLQPDVLPRTDLGRGIVLLAAGPCEEYPGTRCVMDVLWRPGWSRADARELMRQLPDWTSPHFISVTDPELWTVPPPPGRGGEHTPLQRVRRQLIQRLADAEAEIEELRGEDDYTEQQARAEAYALALELLDQEFGT